MKKLIILSYCLFVSLVIVSCSRDDNAPEVFTDTVKYNNISYNVEQLDITDYGTYEGYYNYTFELQGSSSEEAPFYIYLDFFSKGTEAFKTGTFQFFGSEDVEEAPDYWFSYGEIQVNPGEYIETISGSIVITKNGDIYSISGQMTLENDKVVTISYSGTYTFTNDN